jgi:subtilase family serine protease
VKSRFLHALAAVALLSVAATSSQAQKHYYPEQVIVPASSIELPTDIGLAVHTNLQFLQVSTTPHRGATPLGGLGPSGGMTPAQVLSFYKIKAVVGSNAIAIIDAFDTPNALSDFNAFSTQFNLPTETSTKPTASTNKVFQQVYQGGTQPPNAFDYGWDLEEDLDIQWSHAMAPKAKIYLIEAQDNSYTNLMAAVDLALKLTGVKEVSMSWSGGEFSGETSYDSHFPTGKGIVYFASTGDSGSFYGVGYPSVSSYVVGVGGTTEITNSAGKLVAHWGWEGGGGGVSQYVSTPSYQVGVPNADPTYRSLPDVAAIADSYTGVSVYDSNYTPYYGTAWLVVGGTSVACPVTAGLTNSAGHFYADSPTELAHLYANPKKSTDVLTGWNGYFCTKGYDFVTGLGVPDGLLGL